MSSRFTESNLQSIPPAIRMDEDEKDAGQVNTEYDLKQIVYMEHFKQRQG